MVPVRVGLALLLTASLASSTARAQPPAPAALESARQEYRDLQFERAVRTLTDLLGGEELAPAWRREALELLGSSLVVLDRDAEAAAAFREMLALDPYHRVAETSPKITRFLERLRAEVVRDAALDPDAELRATIPDGATGGAPISVTLRAVGDAGRVVDARVHHRERGSRGYRREPAARTSAGRFEWVAELPEGAFELYAEGLDEAGRVVTRAGDPLAPLPLVVGAPRPDDRGGGGGARRWWPWVVVAAVAAGLAVGLGVGLSRDAGTFPPGTLEPGRVELP